MTKLPFRIGYGYDVHAFAKGRELWLGGIKIENDKGLEGHSDADVVLHSISDALLGGLALGDIGVHFPPSDNKYKDIDSKILLREVVALIRKQGYKVGNVDVTIMAERPKIKPYTNEMQRVIASLLGVDNSCVSIKATTTERLGFVGREEGIASSSVALLLLE